MGRHPTASRDYHQPPPSLAPTLYNISIRLRMRSLRLSLPPICTYRNASSYPSQTPTTIVLANARTTRLLLRPFPKTFPLPSYLRPHNALRTNQRHRPMVSAHPHLSSAFSHQPRRTHQRTHPAHPWLQRCLVHRLHRLRSRTNSTLRRTAITYPASLTFHNHQLLPSTVHRTEGVLQ